MTDKPCVCNPPHVQCLLHFGEAKRDAQRARQRPYRNQERRGRRPRTGDNQ